MKRFKEVCPALLLSSAFAAGACSPEPKAVVTAREVDVYAFLEHIEEHPSDPEAFFMGIGARAACSGIEVGTSNSSSFLEFSGGDDEVASQLREKVPELMDEFSTSNSGSIDLAESLMQGYKTALDNFDTVCDPFSPL